LRPKRSAYQPPTTLPKIIPSGVALPSSPAWTDESDQTSVNVGIVKEMMMISIAAVAHAAPVRSNIRRWNRPTGISSMTSPTVRGASDIYPFGR
jgi:hypothetical protein